MGICANPYQVGSMPCPCSTCYPCRINRAKIWSHRIMLESYLHEFNSFVTLTYDEKNLPENGTLKPEDIQDWIKRLREDIYPRKIRYYICGEYGEKSGRPHYHGAIFGMSHIEQKTVENTWSRDGLPIGNVVVRELGPESASYIAGYVTKKLSGVESEWIAKKKKEFTRMSLKPGIGAASMDVVAKAMTQLEDTSKLWNGDITNVLRHSGKLWPLGKYLRGKLREKIGRSKDTPKPIVLEYAKKMSELCEDYIAVEENEEKKRFLKAIGKKSLLVGINSQKVLNFVNRQKILGQKREKI